MENKSEIQRAMAKRVRDAKEELEDKNRGFLRALGWVYTCELPGSIWIWKKDLGDGKTIYMPLDNAVWYELHLAGV